VVIDHVAHMRIRDGIDQPGFRQLLELQREAHIWIKVSNCDRWSAAGAPTYADAIPFGRKLVEANADRLLWATDWPHVMYKDPRNPGDPPPDDGHLLDLFHAFVDRDDAIARQILVDNPLKLYGERPAA
jgi:predicted TIM-barrel fold metal-dependent hydrolase